MNDQEQFKQQLTEVFLNNINHEIRTPVNAIMGFSELVKHTDDPEKRDHFLDIIMNNSRQLVRFLDDLVYLSQLQSGVMYPEYKPVSLNDLLTHIFNHAVEKHDKIHNGTLQLLMKEPPGDEDWRVEIDETMVAAIFHYLLTNAAQSASSGYIKFGFQGKEGDMLRFFVSDTGKGIPAHQQDDLFNRLVKDPFPKSDTNDSMGRNVGLTICKSLCDLMGGDITFESEEGTGSTFYFRLPYYPVREEGYDEPAADKMQDVLAGSAILIVEDDEPSLLYLREVVEGAGMTSYTASTALDGLELIKKKPEIDLVLMDIQLPDINGWKAARLAKEMRNALPVVLQTGYSFLSPENSDKSVYDDFLLKPVNEKKLLHKLTGQIEKQQRSKQ